MYFLKNNRKVLILWFFTAIGLAATERFLFDVLRGAEVRLSAVYMLAFLNGAAIYKFLLKDMVDIRSEPQRWHDNVTPFPRKKRR
jgi:hypothetical protein